MTKAPTPGAEIFETRAGRFFWQVTTRRKTVLLASLALFVTTAAFIPTMTRDTRAEAFIDPTHPSLVYRDKVEEIFGLRDPVVIAVVNDGPQGVFNPATLELVTWLTEQVAELPGVDPDGITSLATENDIYGTEDGMEVDAFLEYPPETQAEADVIRENVMDFPLYLGTLVAEDGSATLIVAELLEQSGQSRNYRAFMDLVERAPIANGEVLHVAGEGAVSEFMGIYIDRDANRLTPISALVITLILLVAFRSLRGTVLPNLVVLGSLAVSIGAMAAMGVPFFVITNSLPVILIAISVADVIHIMSAYYEELAHHPEESQQQLVVRSMVGMWRPVTFTSLTDIAGFAGLSIASLMPPMRYFGLYASVGVAAALLFSVFTIPALLAMLKKKQSAPFRRLDSAGEFQGDAFSRTMAAVGHWVIARPRGVVIATAAITILGVIGALRLEVNEDRKSVFRQEEPIILADNAINEAFQGTNYLDIVIETPEPDGLLKPENLQRIEALQTYVETIPNIGGSTSIVDYMKQMNRAINEDRKEAYVLPDDENLVAQYFLLYSASSDPTDFEEEIDYDYQMANVRVASKTGKYSSLKAIVLPAEKYIEEEFNAEGITAHLAGGVTVDYHWIKELAPSHFKGVALALAGVWLMASISFRSLLAGALTTLPVVLAILALYAVMGFFNIWLGIGTTMFAAISIGVSVDFAIHTIDRLIVLVKDQRLSLDDAFDRLYPSTGRALLFSFLAMVLGFGVLMTSYVPPLNKFGALVAIAVTISFLVSMTVLPAIVKLINPAFLRVPEEENERVVETELSAAK